MFFKIIYRCDFHVNFPDAKDFIQIVTGCQSSEEAERCFRSLSCNYDCQILSVTDYSDYMIDFSSSVFDSVRQEMPTCPTK